MAHLYEKLTPWESNKEQIVLAKEACRSTGFAAVHWCLALTVEIIHTFFQCPLAVFNRKNLPIALILPS